MQQIRFLSEQLKKINDPDEREKIQDEIYTLEELLEIEEEMEYKNNHSSKDYL